MGKERNVPWEEILRRRKEGETARALAEEFGVSVESVYKRGQRERLEQRGSLQQAARKLCRSAGSMVAQMEDMDAKELKELTALLRQLEALPQRLRQAWLEGKWDVFQGQFFQEFVDDPAHYRDRRFTHVIEPFDIPREWSIWRSYDFGYAKPFSCGWWAVDHDGCVYRILELYGCTGEPDEGVKWTPEKQFAEIRRIEDTHPWLKGRDILGVADPAIWDSSRGESIYETALKHRIFFMKGDNRRIPGWMQMHYRMAFDEEGYPQLYVFTGCRAFRRTVPGLLFSETEPEDLDTRMEDHVADESRYLCMARPIPPRRVETALPVQDDPLNMLVRR